MAFVPIDLNIFNAENLNDLERLFVDGESSNLNASLTDSAEVTFKRYETFFKKVPDLIESLRQAVLSFDDHRKLIIANLFSINQQCDLLVISHTEEVEQLNQRFTKE